MSAELATRRRSAVNLLRYLATGVLVAAATVPKGTERLRITPTPFHGQSLIDQLLDALIDVWRRLELPFARSPLAAE